MNKIFRAFSLIEMILTLGILSIVFLLTTKTLTTVIQVSTVVKYKTATRSEVDFAMEFLERVLTNSNIKPEGDDVFIYDTSAWRYYDPVGGTTVYDDSVEDLIINTEYNNSTSTGVFGNEIHIQPYGYEGWMCIGYFKEEDDGDDTTLQKGYLLKRSVDALDEANPPSHKSCFDSTWHEEYPILVLNSEDVNVNDFRVSYTRSELVNNIFYIDLEMEPLFWSPGVSIEKAIIRQSIVTTKGLTWY